jgi:hypothetical protein
MDLNPGVKKISKSIGKLIANCNENFKAVESLCEDIGQHLNAAGDLTEKLSRYINKVSDEYSDYFDHNRITPVTELIHMFETASACLAEVGVQMKKGSSVFATDLQRLFKFTSYENQGLQNLIDQRNSFSDVYEDSKLRLERKKALLLEQKDLRRWGIDPAKLKVNPQDLLKNPNLAKRYMLPQVHKVNWRNHRR